MRKQKRGRTVMGLDGTSVSHLGSSGTVQASRVSRAGRIWTDLCDLPLCHWMLLPGSSVLWWGLSAVEADPEDADCWRLSADHSPWCWASPSLKGVTGGTLPCLPEYPGSRCTKCYYIWLLPFTLYPLTYSHAHNTYFLNFRWTIGKTFLLNHLRTSWNFIPWYSRSISQEQGHSLTQSQYHHPQ